MIRGSIATMLSPHERTVLVAMFWFFPSAIELRGEVVPVGQRPFVPAIYHGLPISPSFPSTFGNHISLFAMLLMTATNIIYTYLNMQSQGLVGHAGHEVDDGL